MMREIICLNCGKKVFKKAWNAKTCSRECNVRLWRKENPERYQQLRISYRRRHGMPAKGSIEHATNVRNSLKGKLAIGKDHFYWRGENASYRTIHSWVQRHKGKAAICEINPLHTSRRYHWANISGKYSRDLSDWRSLCPRCNKNDGVKINSRFDRKGRVVTL